MTFHEDAMSDAPNYAHGDKRMRVEGRVRIVTSIEASGEDLTTLLDLDDELARIITRVARSGDDIIMLLDVDRLTADGDVMAASERGALARKAR